MGNPKVQDHTENMDLLLEIKINIKNFEKEKEMLNFFL